MKYSRVLGTGVDLVENERMQEVLQRWGSRLKNKVFLEEEQKYCESKASPSRHYAARFAVKEAVTKAFGTGIGPHISWLDVEVMKNLLTGAPSIRLHGKAQVLACTRGVEDILISVSHTKTYAVAHALLIGFSTETS